MIKDVLITFIPYLFYQVLYMTTIGSIAGIIVYFIRNIFDNKVSGKLKCIIWFIVLITFLVPIRFEIKTEYPVIQSKIIDTVEDIKYIPTLETTNMNSEIQEIQNESSDIIEKQGNEQFIANKEDAKNEPSIPLKETLINIVIPYIWLSGVIIFVFVFLNGVRKIKNNIPKKVYIDSRIEEILQECKNHLHIKRKVKIILQDYKKVPSIFGILNPKILITEKTLYEDDETIRYIFLHELSHYKRNDILFNYILLVVMSIHWFNPIVWFLFNKIRQDIEIGADELATKELNKSEKKEYGMVLINLLKRRVKENYTANLLCMSDTSKNMERRISMIKRKQKGVIVSTLVALIAIALILVIAFIKTSALEENKTIVDVDNEDNTIQQSNTLGNTDDKDVADNLSSSNANNNNENIDEDERIAIEKYINRICNNTLNERLPECNNINDADKDWIYSHVKSVDDPYYVTKEQVEKQLRDLFGEKLNVDVENDIKNIDDLVLSKAYEDEGKYALPIYGMDNTTYYTIDQIMKKNEQYVVKVIEFNRS